MHSIALACNESGTLRGTRIDKTSRSDIQALLDEMLEAAKGSLNDETLIFQNDVLQ